MKWSDLGLAPAVLAGAFCFGGSAIADTISPTSFSADLAVGESVTIKKTVTVEASGPTSALIDAHFLIDTSGSMGGVIDNAKTAAADLLTSLSSFGDLASGVGVYSERALVTDAIRSGLSTNDATTIAAINAVTLGDPDDGGDYPESGDTAVYEATENLAWRTGSNRFVFVLSDASMKGTDEATVIASMLDKDVTLVGLQFGGSCFSGEPGECSLTQSIIALGGTAYDGGTSPQDIVDAITAGIVGGFSEYSEVTVGDLGNGDPLIDVSTVCLTADDGLCVGASAVGTYNRTKDRTFTFDVTFTRTGAGDTAFDTYALVDGAIVAKEADRFGGGLAPIPLPAAGWLLIASLGGLGLIRRRKA